MPAWAGFGSSHMYKQLFVYVPFVCDVTLPQASVVLCGVLVGPLWLWPASAELQFSTSTSVFLFVLHPFFLCCCVMDITSGPGRPMPKVNVRPGTAKALCSTVATPPQCGVPMPILDGAEGNRRGGGVLETKSASTLRHEGSRAAPWGGKNSLAVWMKPTNHVKARKEAMPLRRMLVVTRAWQHAVLLRELANSAPGIFGRPLSCARQVILHSAPPSKMAPRPPSPQQIWTL